MRRHSRGGSSGCGWRGRRIGESGETIATAFERRSKGEGRIGWAFAWVVAPRQSTSGSTPGASRRPCLGRPGSSRRDRASRGGTPATALGWMVNSYNLLPINTVIGVERWSSGPSRSEPGPSDRAAMARRRSRGGPLAGVAGFVLRVGLGKRGSRIRDSWERTSPLLGPPRERQKMQRAVGPRDRGSGNFDREFAGSVSGGDWNFRGIPGRAGGCHRS